MRSNDDLKLQENRLPFFIEGAEQPTIGEVTLPLYL